MPKYLLTALIIGFAFAGAAGAEALLRISDEEPVYEITQIGKSVWLATGDGAYQVRNDEVLEKFSTLPVFAVAEMKNRIWLGTAAGIYKSDAAGRFTFDGIVGNASVNTIVELSGEAWLGTSMGLYRVSGDQSASIIERERVNMIGVARGGLWVATSMNAYYVADSIPYPIFKSPQQVLEIVDVGDETWALLPNFTGQYSRCVQIDRDGLTGEAFPRLELEVTAAESIDGELWLATAPGNIFKWSQGRLHDVPTSNLDGVVNDIEKINDVVWIATTKGIFRRTGDVIDSILQIADPPNVLVLSPIANQLWLGSSRGAYRLDASVHVSASVGTTFSSSLPASRRQLFLGQNLRSGEVRYMRGANFLYDDARPGSFELVIGRDKDDFGNKLEELKGKKFHASNKGELIWITPPGLVDIFWAVRDDIGNVFLQEPLLAMAVPLWSIGLVILLMVAFVVLRRRRVRPQVGKFLSLAYSRGYLTRYQAARIFAEHSIRDRVESPITTSEIALELRLMNRAGVDNINKLKEEGIRAPEIVRRRFPTKRSLQAINASRVSFALFSLAVLGFCASFTGMEFSDLGGVASIIALVWAALEIMLPYVVHVQRTITGKIRWVAIPVALAVFFYGFSAISYLLEGSPGAQNIEVAVRQQKIALVVFLGLVVLLTLSAFWRHYRIRVSGVRSALQRGLFKALDDAMLDLEKGNQVDVAGAASEILRQSAAILSLNPWANLVRKLGFWAPSSGALSLWYLEPDEDIGRFRIGVFEAFNAPVKVIEAFGKIKDEHRPVMLDHERYCDAVRAIRARAGSASVKEELTKDLFRSTYLSVAGWVSYYGTALETGHAMSCAALDDGYRELALKHLPKKRKTANWLEFRSLAAYPVFDKNTAEPPSVLIAFSDLRNGFSEEDKNWLVSVSRILGMLLRKARR